MNDMNSTHLSRNILIILAPNLSIAQYAEQLPLSLANVITFVPPQDKNYHTNFLPLSHIKKYLGSELSTVILIMNIFNLDQLLAMCGSLTANGKIVLILRSPFGNEHYCNFLNSALTIYTESPIINNLSLQELFHTLENFYNTNNHSLLTTTSIAPSNYNELDTTQQQFYTSVLTQLTDPNRSNNKDTFLLTGARGTGKTFVTQALIHNLIQQQWHICVINGGEGQLKNSYCNITNINLCTPENYHKYLKTTDLLIIEEAASIPMPKLNSILTNCKKAILVTTNLGYEGNAQGIALKLTTPLTQQFILEQPHRYYHDNLENLLQTLQFTNTQYCITQANNTEYLPAGIHLELCQHLITNYALLSQITSLLNAYHYQATPQDLVRWLNSPISYIAYYIDDTATVCSLAIFVKEGPIEPTLAKDILQGTRLPPNNLLPQTLLAHGNLPTAGQYTYMRCERIVTNYHARRQHLASKLLQTVCDYFQDLDFIGTSFAINPATIQFWYSNNFVAISLSLTADNASGMPSLLLLKPQNLIAKNLTTYWSYKHAQTLQLLHTLHAPQLSCLASLNLSYCDLISPHTIMHKSISYNDAEQQRIHSILYAVAYAHHSVGHAFYELYQYYHQQQSTVTALLTSKEVTLLENVLSCQNSKTQTLSKKEIDYNIRMILRKLIPQED